MLKFLSLVGFALLVPIVSFVLYRRAPRGMTKFFLGLTAVSAVAFPLGAVLHNAVDAVFHFEEPVFFLIAVIGAPLGVLVGVVGASITAWTGRHRTA